MKLFELVWKNAYGLVVDDGRLALGTLGAVVITAAWAATDETKETFAATGGAVLFVLVMVFLLANLYLTARVAGARPRK